MDLRSRRCLSRPSALCTEHPNLHCLAMRLYQLEWCVHWHAITVLCLTCNGGHVRRDGTGRRVLKDERGRQLGAGKAAQL